MTGYDVLLVGAGRMGTAYGRVCQALGLQPLVVGRGEASAKAFSEETGLEVSTGGLENWLPRAAEVPHQAIVAVDVQELGRVTLALLGADVKRILVEKPGALTMEELQRLSLDTQRRGAAVVVAYNRRFYASTQKARQFIAEDGGATSFHFEFTELSDVVDSGGFSPATLHAWFLANSTHVVDLAFFLGGTPKSLVARTAGSLDWHPAAARFGGVGTSEAGALFTYSADWDAPGRWGVEVMTRKRRLILRPLEELRVQYRGSLEIATVEIDDDLDSQFKPGIYRQVNAFLSNPSGPDLLTIADQLTRVEQFYQPMVAGTNPDTAP